MRRRISFRMFCGKRGTSCAEESGGFKEASATHSKEQ